MYYKIKELIKPSLIILIIIAVFAFAYYLCSPYANINTEYRVENFKNYKDYYVAFCEEISEFIKTENIELNNEKGCNLSPKYDSSNYRYYLRGKMNGEFKRWYLSEKATVGYEKIKESFPKDNYSRGEGTYELGDIVCFEGEIFFYSGNGLYALMYSADDKMSSPFFGIWDEDKAIKTKKADDNWYHIWR